MRNQVMTGRRPAVVLALLLLAIFALHPACPPEPAHHGALVPGLSGELCHHGDTHHLSPAAPAQAAVQAGASCLAEPDTAGAPVARPATGARPSPPRREHATSGRTVLLHLGISRT